MKIGNAKKEANLLLELRLRELSRPIACPRSSYPFYAVTYYIHWVTTSWTGSISFLML